jgi:hypothetical protein
MSKIVFVGSEEFTLSTQGDPKGWGEDQQELIEALTEAVNSFFGPGDILQTTSLIANNVTAVDVDSVPTTIIPFFQFDSSVVRFAEISYTVIRSTDAVDSTVYEVGKIFILNDPTAAGNPWALNVQNVSNASAGITFGINSSGQVTYISSDLEAEKGGSYQPSDSKIVFQAKAIVK